MSNLLISDYESIFDLMNQIWKTIKDSPGREVYMAVWKKHKYDPGDLKDVIFDMATRYKWMPTLAEIHGEMLHKAKDRAFNKALDDSSVDPEGAAKVRAIISTIFQSKNNLEF